MEPPRVLVGLSSVAADYDALFVDVWGVLHDGRTVFAPALDACRRFRASRGPVVLVSNSPRPGAAVARQIASLGAPTDFFDAVSTSGDTTRAELAARAPGPAFKLGPAKDEPIYDGLDLDVAPLDASAFISCTGLFNDAVETPADYAALLVEAKARDLEMVCANPDVQVVFDGRTIWCAGALAEAYSALGGRVVLAGKPHPPIYALAFESAARAAGRAIDPVRVLAIGDGPDTDLAGAEAQGLDAVFVASGLHAGDLVDASGALDPAAVALVLARSGRRARFAMPGLAW